MIHPPTLIDLAERVCAALATAGREPVRIDVPDGEAAKTAEVAAHCWSVLGTRRFHPVRRRRRGRRWSDHRPGRVRRRHLAARGGPGNLPTTLLGMVDAAVGGKTGINTAEGKNLVGSFHEPVGVLCDLGALATLARADLVAGLAEVVKCGFIADPEILTRIESDPNRRSDPTPRSCASSSSGRSGSRPGWSRPTSARRPRPVPGSAGSCSTTATPSATPSSAARAIVAGTARRSASAWCTPPSSPGRPGGWTTATADRHRRVLSRLGLPTTYPANAFDELLATMAVDKKTRGRQLRFVILNGLASAEILAGPPDELLRSAYADVAAEQRFRS